MKGYITSMDPDTGDISATHSDPARKVHLDDDAQERAKEIGCSGIHSHTEDGETIYMPCETHEEYEELTGDDVKMTIENLHETAKQLLNGK